MIAELKKPSSASTASLGLPDTIFAGLSFPVVPTSDIVVKRNLYNQLNTKSSAEDEDDIEEEIKLSQASNLLISSRVSASADGNNATKGNSTILHTVTPASQRYANSISSQDIKKHLSKLYSNHVSSKCLIFPNTY